MRRLRLVAFPLCMPESSFQPVKSVDSVTVIRSFAARFFRRNFYHLPCTAVGQWHRPYILRTTQKVIYRLLNMIRLCTFYRSDSDRQQIRIKRLDFSLCIYRKHQIGRRTLPGRNHSFCCQRITIGRKQRIVCPTQRIILLHLRLIHSQLHLYISSHFLTGTGHIVTGSHSHMKYFSQFFTQIEVFNLQSFGFRNIYFTNIIITTSTQQGKRTKYRTCRHDKSI